MYDILILNPYFNVQSSILALSLEWREVSVSLYAIFL